MKTKINRIDMEDLTAQDFIDMPINKIEGLKVECRKNIQRGIR